MHVCMHAFFKTVRTLYTCCSNVHVCTHAVHILHALHVNINTLQAIGCQTFYDVLFKHWGCRLRPRQDLVELVEDSDEEEREEVASLGRALKMALGDLVPASFVDLTVDEGSGAGVKEEPLEASVTGSTVQVATKPSEPVEPLQPVKEEAVAEKQPSLKRWQDAPGSPVGKDMDAIEKRILAIQCPSWLHDFYCCLWIVLVLSLMKVPEITRCQATPGSEAGCSGGGRGGDSSV